jgi:gamma-D-glutamyl-L-lysine dipeptidyl-peptidase
MSARAGRRPADTDEVIAAVRLTHVPDARFGVFDVRAERRAAGLALTGEATHDEAVAQLVARLAELGVAAVDEVQRLPDPRLGVERHALVRSAVAPLYAEPRLPAPQISQFVLGMRVEQLSQQGPWTRVRGEDGYIGWVHSGYLRTGDDEWAFGWERASAGEPCVSLGADLADEDGRVLARLPWGARLLRHSGAYHVPDGRSGQIMNGEVVAADRLPDRFPPRGDSIVRTARRWLGTPYIWGGVTPAGADCSGFTQAVLWMHGIALARDSDIQAAAPVGAVLEHGAELRPGDLLYFADDGTRINHVAISLGGSRIIHSALTNGGVDTNDLAGERPFDRRLARILVRARRVLSD